MRVPRTGAGCTLAALSRVTKLPVTHQGAEEAPDPFDPLLVLALALPLALAFTLTGPLIAAGACTHAPILVHPITASTERAALHLLTTFLVTQEPTIII